MSNLAVLSSRAIIGEYFRRLEQGAATWATLLSNFFSSDQAGEDYKWLGMSPAMREWVGGRQAKGLRDNAYTIKNKAFESTLEISIDDLRRDKTGQIMVRIGEQVDRANAHWAKLLSTLIIDGESAFCYDGQLYFDTDHAEGSSGTQSNDLAVDISALPLPATAHGTDVAPAPEEMMHAILEGAQAILGFKDDQGEPMNENARQFLVMVPPTFWKSAIAAVGSATLAEGATNIITAADGFGFQEQVNPRLTWTTKLAVFRTDGNVKPFIRQDEVPVEVSAIAEGSELEFNERVHRYGLYASGNVGYGYWQQSCLVTLT
jgi:phage major head subunit gpT-like protein